jgi:hypothetical protein
MVRAGIARPGRAGIVVRILFFVALTWIPLVLITSWQGTFTNPALKVPFLYDFAETTRFLIVLPLLVIAEAVVEPWLGRVMAHCRELVAESDAEKFMQNIAAAIRSRDSVPVELILIVLAFIRPFVGVMELSTNISSWRTMATATGTEASAAFLWYLFIAKPIIFLLWLRWIWKYIIWSRLLLRTSKLALRVTPMHPDRMGGLGFIAVAQSNFAILPFAFAAQVASYVGEEIFYEGAKVMDFKNLVIALVAIVPIVFLTPCLAFSSRLVECKRRGLLEYGTLADQYTKDFHEKWIEGNRDTNEVLVGSGDISSLADLCNSFDVMKSMQPVIIGKSTIIAFVVATMVPFAPLILFVYPFEELISRLVKMVL